MADVYLESDNTEFVWAIIIALLVVVLLELVIYMQELEPAPDGFHYMYDLACTSTSADGFVSVTVPDAVGREVSFGTFDSQNGGWVERYSATCTENPCTIKWLIPAGETLIVQQHIQVPYPTYVHDYMEEACMGVQGIVHTGPSWTMLAPDKPAPDTWTELFGEDEVGFGPAQEDQICQDSGQWTVVGTGVKA